MHIPDYQTIRNRLLRQNDWRVWQGRLVIWLMAFAAGLVIVFFARLVDLGIEWFNEGYRLAWWMPLIVTPLGGAGIAWLTRKYFAGSEGSGIPQVIAAIHVSASKIPITPLLSLRIVVGKIIMGTGALLCGFSSGREGPSVQVGASLMAYCQRWLPRRFPISAHQLIIAGGSAGIAAAFNTPLAGIVFAIEELGKKFEERTNGVLLTAIILAGVISISMQGNYTYFGRLSVANISSGIWLPVLASAGMCGVLGGVFSRLMVVGSQPWGGRIGAFRKNNPVGFAAFCGLMVALLGVASHGAVHGSGYSVTKLALDGEQTMPFLFAFEKMLATLFSYFAAIPGGIFAPSLAVGAGIGQDLSLTGLGDVTTTAWMALGMAGFLAAVTQAPITSFVIVMEMIDGHAMVISLIATAFIANAISRLISPPLYHSLANNFIKRLHVQPIPLEDDAVSAEGRESSNPSDQKHV
ncbi:chloride channel protein [Leeia sp. TBRC 13508]|uniref:Chloride channel protein n=1 Tax=Leeia speluncae TaxID=2884804 RepID=A0ABS8D6Y1_9NEIS|nr:chloride channel protein [Leeia speluncae]MCB6183953.1 chloride channel protein [Leeia speluncae]